MNFAKGCVGKAGGIIWALLVSASKRERKRVEN